MSSSFLPSGLLETGSWSAPARSFTPISPPYAVVTGNPARVVRFRFSEKKIQELLESKWWLKSIEELEPEMKKHRQPQEGTATVR